MKTWECNCSPPNNKHTGRIVHCNVCGTSIGHKVNVSSFYRKEVGGRGVQFQPQRTYHSLGSEVVRNEKKR